MARPKTEEILRHEPEDVVYVNFHDDDEDGNLVPRDSGIIEAPQPARKTGKGKRSIEDMMATRPNPEAQSIYAMERIAGLEDQIAKVLSLCSPEAKEIVLKRRPSLKKYAPEE